jgi:nucleotidyltransferase substrate binding protein (TIGR01987 family)
VEELSRRLALARRALGTLREVLAEPKTTITRDAAIQRFEYSFETTWKAAQRHLRDAEGLDPGSPASVIRATHAVGLLDETAARLGLEMVRDRNLTVHTYNERLAEDIYSRLQIYLDMMESWLSAIERRGRPR